MKTIKTTSVLFLLIFSYAFSICSLQAQYTVIPDANFEQVLIDLGIDSDGIINGQVLTSDIENVTDLNLSNNESIQDISGIEAFHALENLDVSFTSLSGELDLSANTNLVSLTAVGGGDHIILMIQKTIVNNNPNLAQIYVPEVYTLEQIDLKTGGEDVSDLMINISIIPFGLMSSSEVPSNANICIQVTDASLAQNGEGVYSNWQINTEESSTFNNFFFSETCTFSTMQFIPVDFQLYPNPAQDQVNIKATQSIDEVKIYNVLGRLMYSQKFNQNEISIDVKAWKKDLYFINLEFVDGQKVSQKLLVK